MIREADLVVSVNKLWFCQLKKKMKINPILWHVSQLIVFITPLFKDDLQIIIHPDQYYYYVISYMIISHGEEVVQQQLHWAAVTWRAAVNKFF